MKFRKQNPPHVDVELQMLQITELLHIANQLVADLALIKETTQKDHRHFVKVTTTLQDGRHAADFQIALLAEKIKKLENGLTNDKTPQK